jgi:hypothetical protein
MADKRIFAYCSRVDNGKPNDGRRGLLEKTGNGTKSRPFPPHVSDLHWLCPFCIRSCYSAKN